MGGLRGLRDIEAIRLSHDLELLQGLDLLGVLLAVACPVLGEAEVAHCALGCFLLSDEVIHAIEGHAAVVADDAAAAVGIRQAGNDVGGTRCADARGVDIEDCIVVGLAVAREDLLDLRVGFLTGFLDGLLDHAPTTVGHHGALERRIRLQANDDVIVLGNVPSREGIDIARGVGIHVEDALLALDGQVILLQMIPHALRLLGGSSKEGGVPVIRGVVALDKITNVNVFSPRAGLKALPCLELHRLFRCGGHYFDSLHSSHDA